jgi:hypothetical protein
MHWQNAKCKPLLESGLIADDGSTTWSHPFRRKKNLVAFDRISLTNGLNEADKGAHLLFVNLTPLNHLNLQSPS